MKTLHSSHPIIITIAAYIIQQSRKQMHILCRREKIRKIVVRFTKRQKNNFDNETESPAPQMKVAAECISIK